MGELTLAHPVRYDQENLPGGWREGTIAPTESKQRLFIYDRKEMGVLVLLGVMVALFAFTLGVHLGKRAGPQGLAGGTGPDTNPIATVPDKVPSRTEILDEGKGVPKIVDESLNQALHEEVGRTGIRLDTAKPMSLPEHPKSANAGATTLKNKSKTARQKAITEEAPDLEQHSVAAANRPAPSGRFTLQVGSFKTMDEAKERAELLEGAGLKPFLRSANLKERGRWFRIFVDGFETKDAAEKAGTLYKSKKIIDSFVIARMTE